MPDMGDAQERVLRKVTRLCPPMKSSGGWTPGDIVEVFDKSAWKLAEVRMVVGGGYYSVSLLGSSRVFRAHKSALRLQQSWQVNERIVIGKDLEESSNEMRNKPSKELIYSKPWPLPCIEEKKRLRDDLFSSLGDHNLKDLCQDFLGGIKKQRICSPHAETSAGAGRKKRASEKRGLHQLHVVGRSCRLQEKVHAVASPRTTLGEKYMHASLNNRATKTCGMDKRRTKLNANKEFYAIPIREPSDTESISSSVASCSTSNSPHRSTHHISGCNEDMNSCSDHTETSSGSGNVPLPRREEAVAPEIHRLELHAYQATLVALHASGPISWEQEALMTNLRLMLHISTDEHLLELRKLASTQNNAAHS